MSGDEAVEGSALASGADSTVAVEKEDWRWRLNRAVLADRLVI